MRSMKSILNTLSSKTLLYFCTMIIIDTISTFLSRSFPVTRINSHNHTAESFESVYTHIKYHIR